MSLLTTLSVSQGKLSETENVRASLELRSELVLSGLASTSGVTRVADSSIVYHSVLQMFWLGEEMDFEALLRIRVDAIKTMVSPFTTYCISTLQYM